MKHPHQLSQSHELILHTNPDLYDFAPNLQIPRVVGCSIPHASNEKKYAEFMLAHFKPFSPTNALLKPTETFEDVFQSYCFNKFSKQVMLNWKATVYMNAKMLEMQSVLKSKTNF